MVGRKSEIFISVAFSLILATVVSTSAWAQVPRVLPDDERRETEELRKRQSIFDRGIAFMDAGVMQVNGVENYGMIGRRGFPYCKHGFWGEVRWIIPFLAVPKQPWATNIHREEGNVVDRSNYFNVIESITSYFCEPENNTNYPDWEAMDYSSQYLMGDDDWSGRPLIATSTRPLSWPEGYIDKDPTSETFRQFIETPGERHWPGNWAIDSETGKEVEGEFVSSKDIYFIMDDKYNGIRLGDDVSVGFPIGFDMEVNGYCYSTRVYEDVVFFNYNLIYRNDITDANRQFHTGTIDSLYFGFFIDPDLPGRDPEGYTTDPWAEDDYVIADTLREIFLMFDKDGYDRDDDDINSEGPVSAYAIAYLKTPNDVGLTGFHWFDQYIFDEERRGESVERLMYAMASGRPELLTPQKAEQYFHGDDPHFDDLTTLRDYQESFPVGDRPDPWFMMTSGPFSASPGDTLPLHFCIVGGNDNPGLLDTDGFPTNPYEVRFADVLTNYEWAMKLYSQNFRGTGPPKTPTLSAVGTKVTDEDGLPFVYTEDGKVTLYWDDIAEKSVDIATKKRDFEGYRIYKAFYDPGLDYVDWGQEVYDISYIGVEGGLLTYVPVFQCDKINDWEDFDPYQDWFYLGSNSGIVHSWTDTDVINGVRYRYCVTAYDHPDLDFGFAANEVTRGKSSKDLNVIDAIPGVRPVGYIPANADTVFQRLTGHGTGPIELELIDDNAVTGHTYTLEFSDTTGRLEYSVFDEDDQIYKVIGSTNIVADTDTLGLVPNASPAFDGVGLKIINHDLPEIAHSAWTSVGGDTSDWVYASLSVTYRNPADYEIRFLGEGADTNVVGTKTVPFQVWNITVDPPRQVDLFISPPTGDFQSSDVVKLWEYLDPDSPQRTFTWVFTFEWEPDTVIVGSDTTINPQGRPPEVGDVYTFFTKKPFTNDRFRFSTHVVSSERIEDDDLSNIKTVPNPYVVTSRTELYTGSSLWERKEIRFIHLPPECTIDIYTLTGDHVRTLEHSSPTYGEARWDLLTEENLEVSYGVYIYVVKTPNGAKKIDKLAIVK